MADEDKTFDLTPHPDRYGNGGGMDLRALDKSKASPYIQNIIPRNGEFLVRPGFGLVCEYDTTLNAGRTSKVITYGLSACIGATRVRTGWGAEQILAIHPVYAFTGDAAILNDDTDIANKRAQYLAGVVAMVFDVTTGRKVEFVLHYQDTDNTLDLPNVYPNYATKYDETHARWAIPQSVPTRAVFSPQSNGSSGAQSFNIVIAIEGMGLWTYRPVDIALSPNRQNSSTDRLTFLVQAGEQGAFSPLGLSPGLNLVSDGFAYLTTTDLGDPTAMCVYNSDRMVYAVGHTLYFADPFFAGSILVDSAYVIPTPDAIVCVASVNNGIFVATSGGKCGIYQPAIAGGTIAGGTFTWISQSNGCVSNQSYCQGNAQCYFVDDSGVYMYNGGIGLTWLSEPIDRLWTDPQSLQLPLTDFYQHGGVTGLSSVQLPARINVREQMRTSRLVWDDIRKTLHCVCDDFDLIWTTPFGWSVWLFQTHAGNGARVVGVANIVKPVLVPVRQDLYMVGGPDVQAYQNHVGAPSLAVTDRGCYLLKLGRGGALDRSTCMDPSLFDVYTCTLSGYIVAGDRPRVTIAGNAYTLTVLPGQDFAMMYAMLAPLAAADTNADVVAFPDRIVVIAKTAATSVAVSSSMVVGAGTFTTVHTQSQASADVTDADLEDQRTPVGGYIKFVPRYQNLGAGAFFVKAPIAVPAGFQPLDVTAPETAQTYWFPVAIQLPGATPVHSFLLHFSFDNTRWQPICRNDGGHDASECAVNFPAERLGSVGGYLYGAPDGTHQIRVWDSGSSTYTPWGDTIRIDFNGAGGAWDNQPYLNAGTVGPDILFYLGFRYIGNDTSLWLSPTFANNAAQINLNNVNKYAAVYFWTSGRYNEQYAALAAKQQCVDWALKTVEVGQASAQLRVRGVALTAMHLGGGSPKVRSDWIYGPLNTATSADYKDYSGQAVDFTADPVGNSLQQDIGVFPRLQLVSGGDLVTKTAGAGAKWGDSTDASKGNLLIDDAAVDTLWTTDGTQGVRVSVMVHGTMNAASDSVRLQRIEAVLRHVGSAHRWRNG